MSHPDRHNHSNTFTMGNCQEVSLSWLYLINGMDNGLEDGMDYGLEDGTCNGTVVELLSYSELRPPAMCTES